MPFSRYFFRGEWIVCWRIYFKQGLKKYTDGFSFLKMSPLLLMSSLGFFGSVWVSSHRCVVPEIVFSTPSGFPNLDLHTFSFTFWFSLQYSLHHILRVTVFFSPFVWSVSVWLFSTSLQACQKKKLSMKVQNRKCIFCLHDCVCFFLLLVHGEKIFSACDFLRLPFFLVCVFFPLIIFYTKTACLDSWAAKYSEFVLYNISNSGF